jgi:hypothetical protein
MGYLIIHYRIRIWWRVMATMHVLHKQGFRIRHCSYVYQQNFSTWKYGTGIYVVYIYCNIL